MDVEIIKKTALQIQNIFCEQLDYGIILGSGLGSVTDTVVDRINIPYGEIPGWPLSTVLGHNGELILGKIGSKNILIMKGRVHYYEGYSMQEITRPIRVMQKMGIKKIIITNAAGAVNPDFQPGDIKTGTIASIERFGLFIELKEGIEGLLHISELGHNATVDDVSHIYKIGSTIIVRVLEIIPEDHRIALGLVEQGD